MSSRSSASRSCNAQLSRARTSFTVVGATVLLTLSGCLTSNLVASTTHRKTPLIAGGSAEAALLGIGVIVGAAIATDVVTFPIQCAFGFYPYGRRFAPESEPDALTLHPR